MSHCIARTMAGPFDSVLDSVSTQLKARGFGMLTEIDVQATLRTKLGVATPRYRILAARNPEIAHEPLRQDERLGVLLPCYIMVRETSLDEVEVASFDPESPEKGPKGRRLPGAAAAEVRRLLREAIEAVAVGVR